MPNIVKVSIEPTMILVSSKADDAVLDHLDPGSMLRGSENGSEKPDQLYEAFIR